MKLQEKADVREEKSPRAEEGCRSKQQEGEGSGKS
jgi:hypothetical protein